MSPNKINPNLSYAPKVVAKTKPNEKNISEKYFDSDEPEYNPSKAKKSVKKEIIVSNKLRNDLIGAAPEDNQNLSSNNIVLMTDSSLPDSNAITKLQSTHKVKRNSDFALFKNMNSSQECFKPAAAPYIRNNPLKKKYCLVLDLDETLIHFKVDPNSPNDNGEILARPYLTEFLTTLEIYYELILFTAGTEEVTYIINANYKLVRSVPHSKN